MLESTYKITLDIHEINSQHMLFCKQGDTQRRIVANLIEESELYRISEDCTAAFVAVKPDGKVVFNDARIEGNTIVYDFTPQTCNVSGKVMCELRLYGYDNAQITSPGFILNVHPAIDTTVVESATEINVLTGLISEAITLLDTVNGKLANGDFVPKMTIGEVKTLPAGSNAIAWFTGTGTAPVLNLGLPQGNEGQAESLIPDTELSSNSTKPVQNKVIKAAVDKKADKAETEAAIAKKADKDMVLSYFQIGMEEPISGPALWLDTTYSIDDTDIAILDLEEDETGAMMMAHVDGEDYAVTNSSVNSTPTDENYDFTVQA